MVNSFADDVASHIDSNWNEDSGNNPKPSSIVNALDAPRWDTEGLHEDRILLHSETLGNSVAGLGHENKAYSLVVRVWAATTDGTASSVKERLEIMRAEVEHVLNSKNHLISGFTLHYCRDWRNLSDGYNAKLSKGAKAVGEYTLVAFKTAEAIT